MNSRYKKSEAIKELERMLCNKIYKNKKSCKSHQYKCHWNPKNKSCASCSFCKMFNYDYKEGHTLRARACLNNHDISKKLRTKCEHYLDKKYSDDEQIMDIVNNEIYDHEKAKDFNLQLIKPN